MKSDLYSKTFSLFTRIAPHTLSATSISSPTGNYRFFSSSWSLTSAILQLSAFSNRLLFSRYLHIPLIFLLSATLSSQLSFFSALASLQTVAASSSLSLVFLLSHLLHSLTEPLSNHGYYVLLRPFLRV